MVEYLAKINKNRWGIGSDRDGTEEPLSKKIRVLMKSKKTLLWVKLYRNNADGSFVSKKNILNGEMESHVHINFTKVFWGNSIEPKMASTYYRQTLVLIIQTFRLYIATEII